MHVPQKSFATVETLQVAFPFLTTQRANLVRSLVKEEIKAEDCVCSLSDEDFADLPREEKILAVIDGLIRGFGVEALTYNDDSPRDFYAVPYVNRGDTYDATILYHNGAFKLTSWGDLVEAYGS